MLPNLNSLSLTRLSRASSIISYGGRNSVFHNFPPGIVRTWSLRLSRSARSLAHLQHLSSSSSSILALTLLIGKKQGGKKISEMTQISLRKRGLKYPFLPAAKPKGHRIVRVVVGGPVCKDKPLSFFAILSTYIFWGVGSVAPLSDFSLG